MFFGLNLVQALGVLFSFLFLAFEFMAIRWDEEIKKQIDFEFDEHLKQASSYQGQMIMITVKCSTKHYQYMWEKQEFKGL